MRRGCGCGRRTGRGRGKRGRRERGRRRGGGDTGREMGRVRGVRWWRGRWRLRRSESCRAALSFVRFWCLSVLWSWFSVYVAAVLALVFYYPVELSVPKWMPSLPGVLFLVCFFPIWCVLVRFSPSISHNKPLLFPCLYRRVSTGNVDARFSLDYMNMSLLYLQVYPKPTR